MAEAYALPAFPVAITSPAVEVSLAVSTVGANAVQANVVIMVAPRFNTLTIAVEGSNDMENWVTLQSFGGLGVGYQSGIVVSRVP